MTYKEAIELKKESIHLIGTTNHRGFKVTDIWIVPTDQDKRNEFMLCYIQNGNASSCLMHYVNEDLTVMCVDTSRLHDDLVVFYDIIRSEPVLAN